MQKLKIAFDAKRLLLNHTGLGNYSRTLVRNLVNVYPENEYHLFTPDISNNDETAFFLNHPAITIHKHSGFSKAMWRSFGMAKEINALEPAIYHGLSHEIPNGLDQKIVKVVSFHDLIWEIYPKQFPFFDRWMYHYKYKKSAIGADHIVAVSKSTASDLQSMYNISEKKVSVIYQACGDYFKTHQFHTDRTHYLYVGSIIERKGLDRIIKALSKIPSEIRKPLIVVGDGKGNYQEQCKRAILENNLENWVSLVGKVANAQLTKLYDEAIALVFPSIYEGFGIPVIEAINRACPVITSNVSSLPEAGVALTTLVDPMDVDAIAKAMVNTLSQPFTIPDPTTIHQALAPFDGPYAAQQLMQLYQKLLMSNN